MKINKDIFYKTTIAVLLITTIILSALYFIKPKEHLTLMEQSYTGDTSHIYNMNNTNELSVQGQETPFYQNYDQNYYKTMYNNLFGTSKFI